MAIKKDIQIQFGNNADAYVNSDLHKKGEDLKKIIDLTQLQGTETVLDVATGGGHTALALAPFAKNVVALDLTEQMLLKAEAYALECGHENISFICGDAENMPFPDEQFDLVTCRIAAHHFPKISLFLQESYRVLKKGGTLILDDNVAPENDELDFYYNEIEKKRDYSHHRAWKKSEWIHMIEHKGFRIEELCSFPKYFQFESWCSRMQLSMKEKQELNDYMCAATSHIKEYLEIKTDNILVQSFRGEAVILTANK
ncbi:class I SAM-dependent methyltransferase [Aquibacillus koreensis]|uniref:Class I SAM-dependent methyltransferase n=1 Tax=Aquibacillus koreensis TaxID=279446 RepID=A0A9X3WFS1_9BACI|nr:class I SAM-dependent methyltransferase [Aquibacillus koreensis]MCT2537536.1 class I SAM-dependent methyltransferase [Aquibacillus koreensis]MDC3418982.1 class I SAM-dependent methyltransferase [Aquibacillus koreensis]